MGLLDVALLRSRILSFVPDSWKICGPLRMITWTDGRFDVLLLFSLIQEVPEFPTIAQNTGVLKIQVCSKYRCAQNTGVLKIF